MRRASLGKGILPAAQRLRRAHLRRRPRPSAGPGPEGSRRTHRLGRTGPAGGDRRPPDRPQLLRPLDPGMTSGRLIASHRITSLTNPTVKAVRALHMRKEREESGLFLAEGLKIVIEAIDLGHAPAILMYGPDAASHPLLQRAAQTARDAGGEVIEVSREVLEKVSRRDNPQAVVAVFRQVYTPLADIRPQDAPCWVALQAVRDPGNLGTIVRTADAAGCGGVILVGDCTDPFSVEAVRATMGSVFAVKIAKA